MDVNGTQGLKSHGTICHGIFEIFRHWPRVCNTKQSQIHKMAYNSKMHASYETNKIRKLTELGHDL